MSFHILFVLILCISVCGGAPFTKPNGDLDTLSVAQHILALEQTVSDLHSEFQAQEQKQAAVLSSVLSKLASTTDELVRVNTKLEALEGRHNSTLDELSRVNNELKDLSGVKTEVTILRTEYDVILEELDATKNDLNATRTDFMALRLQANASHLDLDNGTDQITSTKEMLATNANILRMLEAKNKTDVAYEVILTSHAITVHNNQTLNFPNVLYNKGGAYNTISGIFTAKVSGTYMFWANVMTKDGHSIHISMYKEGKQIGKGYAPNAVSFGTASILTVINLNEGDKVWLVNRSGTKSGTVTINGDSFSSYGGALLHAQ